MKNVVLFTLLLSINLFAHEDGGEKDIRCSVTYSTAELNRTYYAMTIQPAISMTFLNNHVDVDVMPPLYCRMIGEDELCMPWEGEHPGVAPTLEFIAETKNGIQFTGKYAILNYQDPPRIKPHPTPFENLLHITKEQYDEAETELNYCVLIY